MTKDHFGGAADAADVDALDLLLAPKNHWLRRALDAADGMQMHTPEHQARLDAERAERVRVFEIVVQRHPVDQPVMWALADVAQVCRALGLAITPAMWAARSPADPEAR